MQSLHSDHALTDTAEAEDVLQNFFKSVFVAEGNEEVPHCPPKVDEDTSINNMELTEDIVTGEDS